MSTSPFAATVSLTANAQPYPNRPMCGQVQWMFIDLPTGGPRVKAGQLTAYAVIAGKRSSVLPDVPTMAESGLPVPAAERLVAALGVELAPASPQELDAFLKSQLVDWARFLKGFNIAPEN
jgi:tripartite-type tricarboxylate transporter receptor subunit TctC